MPMAMLMETRGNITHGTCLEKWLLSVPKVINSRKAKSWRADDTTGIIRIADSCKRGRQRSRKSVSFGEIRQWHSLLKRRHWIDSSINERFAISNTTESLHCWMAIPIYIQTTVSTSAKKERPIARFWLEAVVVPHRILLLIIVLRAFI